MSGNSAQQTTIPISGTTLDLSAPALPPVATSDLESVELVFRLLELLAGSRQPMGVTEVARLLGISKPRAHRHLRALVQRGYARQDLRSEGYEIGIRLVMLGEQVRERFDVVGAIRPLMPALRAATGLAVTASALVGEEVVVLELLQGASVIDFGVRPGSKLDLHASAHGLVALAFGPAGLLDAALASPLRTWTEHTLDDPAALQAEVARVRRQGWATAVDAVQIGVNALAAPVRDHRGVCRGSVALVGATQSIPAQPTSEQIELVTRAAADASRGLGWEAA
ncbi:MAG: transcriptional regulator, IclR family [Phenylobacterium sp.]|nr:transcriptional regulator, IclR family [Phenylobacterium sp.]